MAIPCAFHDKTECAACVDLARPAHQASQLIKLTGHLLSTSSLELGNGTLSTVVAGEPPTME